MGIVRRASSALYRHRWRLFFPLALMAAMIAWSFYFGHLETKCRDQKTTAACARVMQIERWACDHGIEGAFLGGCGGLAWKYEAGAGVAVDHRQAIGYYRRSCTSAYTAGCALAWSFYTDALADPHFTRMWGGPTGPRPSAAYQPEYARDLADVLADAERLCATDFRDGCVGSANHHELLRMFCEDLPRAHGAIEDARGALPHLLRECDAGNARACGLAGQILAYGIGVKRDIARGKTLLERACAAKYRHWCITRGGWSWLETLESAERVTGSIR